MTTCDTLFMSGVKLDRPEPWTEAEYFALGETNQHIELIDGELRVNPGVSRPHQDISLNLATILKPVARASGLATHLPPIDVRLAPGRVVQPDLFLDKAPRLGSVTDSADVILVCEVTSPSNAAYDRGRKMQLYAEARIPWYLLVEPDMVDYESVTLRLLRLDGDHYVEHAVAKDGETLVSDAPFPLEISTEHLLD